MADVNTFQRIVLKFSSPYARISSNKVWSVKFSLTPPAMAVDNMEATALALATPILGLCGLSTYLSSALHYPAGSDINDTSYEWAPGAQPGTLASYNTHGTPYYQQLEVTAHVFAQVGRSSKGRPTYLSKSIHDVLGQAGDTGMELCTLQPGALSSLELAWGSAGPQDLVVCSPTTGAIPTSWGIRSALYTRQVRRGQKAKA